MHFFCVTRVIVVVEMFAFKGYFTKICDLRMNFVTFSCLDELFLALFCVEEFMERAVFLDYVEELLRG